MTTLADMARPSLAGWGKYLNVSGHFNEAPDAGAQDFLRRLQAYDPNASIQTTTNGDNGQQGYTFNYDITKMPKAEQSDNLQGAMPVISSGAMEVNDGFDKRALVNPGRVHSDNIYGKWTPGANAPDRGTILDTLGPLAVGAFTMGAPALFSALSGGALGGAMGSLGTNAAFNAARSGVDALRTGNPLSALGLVGMVPGFDSIAPYLNLAKNAYGASRGNLGAGAQTIAGLYRMFGGGGA